MKSKEQNFCAHTSLHFYVHIQMLPFKHSLLIYFNLEVMHLTTLYAEILRRNTTKRQQNVVI